MSEEKLAFKYDPNSKEWEHIDLRLNEHVLRIRNDHLMGYLRKAAAMHGGKPLTIDVAVLDKLWLDAWALGFEQGTVVADAAHHKPKRKGKQSAADRGEPR